MLRATHAGSWYPLGQQLQSQLEAAFSRATVDANAQGTVRAIVVPHAGYRYCVGTAAYAFKSVNPTLYDRVIILGPSHRLYVDRCTIADADSFETPFGPIPFDLQASAQLVSQFPQFFKRLDRRTAEKEHSLEMECPLLKWVFKERPFTVIPIMVGAVSEPATRGIAAALAPLLSGGRTLLVVSSDFCHWGSDFDYTFLPSADGSINARIEALDREGMAKIATRDVDQFAEFIARTGDTICGELAIKIAMRCMAGTDWAVAWPHYSQSAVVRAARDSCVSYAAGIFRCQ
jgi:AmmeMemoRadiSam system protein B